MQGWLPIDGWHGVIGIPGERNNEGGRCLKFECRRTLEWKMDDGRRKNIVIGVAMYKDSGKGRR